MKLSGLAPYTVRLAKTEQDLHAAHRLRYDVFVQELGGTGEGVDHAQKLEKDRFDPHYDHLLLIDDTSQEVVGVYRVLTCDGARAAGGFYSASEYDLTPLLRSGRRLLELGRSCLHRDHRGGHAMHYLWNGLARYVAQHQVEVLFGVASFHGTDPAALAEPLSLLHHRHLAPPALRVRAKGTPFQTLDLLPEDQINRPAAMRQVPSLIKAYLRLGGCVGEGAFIDHAFNTVDVCLIMDTAQLNERQARIYSGAEA
ncbi:MAG: GNAT family N-acetyltransferase [Sulfitobacter sp.]